jgi:serine phosphatase RsbU (regulator of sigma subunit)
MVRRVLSILVFNALVIPVFSQQEALTFTESRFKAEYTLLLASYVEWPDSIITDRYEFGVLGSSEVFNDLIFKAETDDFKEKPFSVKYFKRIKNITPVHVLFIGREANEKIKKIWSKTRGMPVLLVTDSCEQFENIMINLLVTTVRGGRQFEINKQNINAAGLDVSQKILYDGLREDELRVEYRASGKQIESIRQELENLNAELELSYIKLERRIEEIDSLNQEIIAQKEELDALAKDINQQQKSLADKTFQLQQQEAGLNELIREIALQGKQLKLQQDSIRTGNQILRLQKDSIMHQQDSIINQQEKIRIQQGILGEQTVIIERQQYLLYFFLLLLLLVSGIVFFVIRAYRIKRSANRILRDKNASIAKQNAEISRQKEEILAQREQLEIINKAIEKQNEDIKASIYYALTIQNAILPRHQEIEKYYSYFAIYLPKDIVAGDFYWFTNISETRKSGDMSFFAVVDCTGHGVPGGFLSMIGSRILGTIVNENHIYEPDKILSRMDKNLRMALKQDHTEIDDGMDVCLIRIEREKDKSGRKNGKAKILFSGARRPLYVLNNQGIEMIRGDRKTIGGRYNAEQEFTNQEFILSEGDRIYLTTDGITDQNSPEREKFGINRLKEVLFRTFHLSIEEQKRFLEEELLGFMKYEKQRDDITVMGVQI